MLALRGGTCIPCKENPSIARRSGRRARCLAIEPTMALSPCPPALRHPPWTSGMLVPRHCQALLRGRCMGTRNRSAPRRLRAPCCMSLDAVDAAIFTALLAAVGYTGAQVLLAPGERGQGVGSRRDGEGTGHADNEGEGEGEEEEDVPSPFSVRGQQWGLTAVISAIPFFNWMAWVFPALTSQGPTTQYWVFAALYALPLLHDGLSGDPTLPVLSALVCAAHVQLERVRVTELDGRPLMPDAAKLLKKGLDAVPPKTALLSPQTLKTWINEEVAEAERQAIEVQEAKSLEAAKTETTWELEAWDNKLREAMKNKEKESQ